MQRIKIRAKLTEDISTTHQLNLRTVGILADDREIKPSKNPVFRVFMLLLPSPGQLQRKSPTTSNYSVSI